MSNIPVNTKTLEEALILSEEILTAIELETASLSSCMLKASRLARLLNDFDYQKIFIYESGSYPEYGDRNLSSEERAKLLILSKRVVTTDKKIRGKPEEIILIGGVSESEAEKNL